MTTIGAQKTSLLRDVSQALDGPQNGPLSARARADKVTQFVEGLPHDQRDNLLRALTADVLSTGGSHGVAGLSVDVATQLVAELRRRLDAGRAGVESGRVADGKVSPLFGRQSLQKSNGTFSALGMRIANTAPSAGVRQKASVLSSALAGLRDLREAKGDDAAGAVQRFSDHLASASFRTAWQKAPALDRAGFWVEAVATLMKVPLETASPLRAALDEAAPMPILWGSFIQAKTDAAQARQQLAILGEAFPHAALLRRKSELCEAQCAAFLAEGAAHGGHFVPVGTILQREEMPARIAAARSAGDPQKTAELTLTASIMDMQIAAFEAQGRASRASPMVSADLLLQLLVTSNPERAQLLKVEVQKELLGLPAPDYIRELGIDLRLDPKLPGARESQAMLDELALEFARFEEPYLKIPPWT